MSSSTLMVGKVLACLTGVYTRWKVRWALWSGWEGEEEKTVKIKAAKVRQGHVRKWEELNALEKADGGIFLSYFMVWCAHVLNCERWSDRSSQSAGCRCFSGCQISGCYPVILLVCLNMASIPEKHWRPHYLAMWTTNPKYIFSHYSSLLYLQSKDESPNQRMPIAHGIILTHECPLLWGDLRTPGLHATSCCLQSSVQPHEAVLCPGLLPWTWPGVRPRDTGGGALISASAIPLTVVTSMLLSLSFPSSFSSAPFVSTSNHWLTSRCLTLRTQERPIVTYSVINFKFLVSPPHGSLC